MHAAALPPTIGPRASVPATLVQGGGSLVTLDQGSTGGSALFTALLDAAVGPDAPTPTPAPLPLGPGKILPLSPPDGISLPSVAAAPEQDMVLGPVIKVPIKIVSEMVVRDDAPGGDQAAGAVDERDVEPNKRLRPAPHAAVELLAPNGAIRVALQPLPVASDFAATAATPAIAPSATIDAQPVSAMPNLAAPKAAVSQVALAAAGLVIDPAAEAPAPSPPRSANAARPEPATVLPQAPVMPGPSSTRREQGRQSAAEPDCSAAVMAPPSPVAQAVATLAVANQGSAPGIGPTPEKPLATIDRTDHYALVEAVARARGEPSPPAVMLVRNSDFGPISIRLDAAGADLHAMLGSDDPEFRTSVIAAADQSLRLPASASVPSPAVAAALRDGSGDRPTGTGPGSSSAHTPRHEPAPHQNLAGQQEPGQRERQDRPNNHRRHDPHRATPTLAMIRRGRDDDASRLPRRDAGIFA